MSRYVCALFFSLITMYSSLAGVATNLHLIDHDNNHYHNYEDEHFHEDGSHHDEIHHEANHEEELFLEHYVKHASHNESNGHGHEVPSEALLATFVKDSLSQISIQPLFFRLYQGLVLSVLELARLDDRDLPPVFIAYNPPPDHFRSLTLLN